MISRFKGKANLRSLVEAICRQQIVEHNLVLAEELAQVAELIQVDPGPPQNVFINQGRADNDIYLILAGRVVVQVCGREVAIRSAGQHVGEMAMIDPAAPRCATVMAVEDTVIAKITEKQFAQIADRHPSLWRQLARELGARLRERGRFIKEPNPRPVVFIGSSGEQRKIAFQIRDGLSHEPCLPKVWTDDLFRPSATSIENLERELQVSDFAVLVITADDLVVSRKVTKTAPRDNVVWEHGFFTGGLGRHRTFIVKPRGVDLKLPSDLFGVTPLDFDPQGDDDDLAARVGPSVNKIRREIERHGPK